MGPYDCPDVPSCMEAHKWFYGRAKGGDAVVLTDYTDDECDCTLLLLVFPLCICILLLFSCRILHLETFEIQTSQIFLYTASSLRPHAFYLHIFLRFHQDFCVCTF